MKSIETRLHGAACALVVILLGGAPVARAQAPRSVGVVVSGCDPTGEEGADAIDLARDVARALGLEVGTDVRVEASATPDHEVLVQIEMSGCDAGRWTLRIAAPDGRVLFGPEETAMGEFTEHARVRIAALWAAERLADRAARVPRSEDAVVEVGEVGEADDGSDESDASGASAIEPTPAEPIIPPPPEGNTLPPEPPPFVAPAPEPSPEPTDRMLPTLMVSVGGGGFVDPASLDSGTVIARVGIGARLHELFFVSGALEGGLLVEPFNHVQPVFRLCAEPQLYVELVDRVALSVGARGCLSTSRHLRNAEDEWGVGIALGGLSRLTFDLGEGLGLGVRFDADAWERDGIVPTSLATVSGPTADLPWLGMFTGALELTLF